MLEILIGALVLGSIWGLISLCEMYDVLTEVLYCLCIVVGVLLLSWAVGSMVLGTAS